MELERKHRNGSQGDSHAPAYGTDPDQDPSLQRINTLKEGDAFGELALLDPNNTRTATVIVKKQRQDNKDLIC